MCAGGQLASATQRPGHSASKGFGGTPSGIQIRSAVSDAPTTEEWYGKEIKVPAGRVHGPQVEIDPSAQRLAAARLD